MNDATDQTRAIAAEAYQFGYTMVENYRTLYEQAVDDTDPRSSGANRVCVVLCAGGDPPPGTPEVRVDVAVQFRRDAPDG